LNWAYSGNICFCQGPTSEEGLAAEKKADAWMHGAAGDVEVDAVVGEGPLSKDVIRRSDDEAYTTQGP
jgi:hypothetical protein